MGISKLKMATCHPMDVDSETDSQTDSETLEAQLLLWLATAKYLKTFKSNWSKLYLIGKKIP